jgi:hypothetical protein
MSTKKQLGRTSVSLSFSVPPEWELAMNARAAECLLSRSEYLREMLMSDLINSGHLEPIRGDAPPRIRRNQT